ncbi:MAG: hypothetical protein IKF82_00305 [Bacilli bacterium]|nr:hypothetical protein [Bacilli bacterium]
MSYLEKELTWINENNGNELSVEKFFSDTFSSNNNCILAGEHSIFAAPLTLDIAFHEMLEYANVEVKGEMKYEDVYVKISEKVEMLSLNDINNLAQKLINDFINENSGHHLRIWNKCSNQGWFNDEKLEHKYYRLVKELRKWYGNWLQTNLNVTYKIEAYLIGREVNSLLDEYSFASRDYFADECDQLWGLITTIHHSFYNQELINSLFDVIEELVHWCCPKDYKECDLTDKKVLHQLYIELCEELHKEDGFKGLDFFHSFDGYGNTIFDLDGSEYKDFYWEITKDGDLNEI